MPKNSQSTLETMLFEAANAAEAGDTSTAADIYREPIAVHPECAPAYVNLGTLHAHEKRFEAAAALYFKAIEVDPNYTMGHFNYANVLEELGQLSEACQSYERALETNPRHADSHFNLALAYERAEDFRQAVRHWEAYLELDKGSKWSAVARQHVESLTATKRIQVVARTESPARTLEPRPALFLVK